MRREGRPHGMVRTCIALDSPRPNSRILNELTGPPTAGLFTKVQPRPTNHSKFTGKCGRPRCRGCHASPAGKSRGKAKGGHKTRSASAAGADYSDGEDDDYDSDGWDISGHGFGGDDLCANGMFSSRDKLLSEALEIDELWSRAIENGVDENDDDYKMSFCEVGIACESVGGDEGWCLVDEKNVMCC